MHLGQDIRYRDTDACLTITGPLDFSGPVHRTSDKERLIMLALYNLGDNGRQWLSNAIDLRSDWSPTMPIATAISRSKPKNGAIYALVGQQHGDLHDYDHSVGNDGQEVLLKLDNWISEYVSLSPHHICLIDEQMMRPDDQYWKTKKMGEVGENYLLSNDSIFYRITQKNYDNSSLASILAGTFRHFLCYAMVNSGVEEILSAPAGSNIQQSVIDKCLARKCGIVVDAYDVDGCILWTEKDNSVDGQSIDFVNPWR